MSLSLLFSSKANHLMTTLKMKIVWKGISMKPFLKNAILWTRLCSRCPHQRLVLHFLIQMDFRVVSFRSIQSNRKKYYSQNSIKKNSLRTKLSLAETEHFCNIISSLKQNPLLTKVLHSVWCSVLDQLTCQNYVFKKIFKMQAVPKFL